MSRKDSSRLGGDLIARKGEASPTTSATSEIASLPQTNSITETPRGTSGTVAITVRLDPDRYVKLKTLGAQIRRKNQDILVEALDMFFEKWRNGLIP